MTSLLCRLCLNSENVVDIFHPDLTNSERLRSCILLATGINISRDDVVTKHVCASCCDISVKLYKFRKNALANDRALKIQLKQSCLEGPAKVEDIVTTNKTIVEELLNRSAIPSPAPTDSYVVHPSIRRLYKTHQNLIIPKELLRVDLDPSVLVISLDKSEIPTYQIVQDTKDPLDIFKASRPEINVNIIKAPQTNKRPIVEDEEEVEAKRPKIDHDVLTNKIEVVQTNRIDDVQTNTIDNVQTDTIDNVQTNTIDDVQTNTIADAQTNKIDEEGPDCLKDTQNLIGEARTKPHAKVSYMIRETETGKENLGGSNKIVLARVTSKEPVEPAYMPESDESSSTSSSTFTVSPPWKMLRPRKSRPSFFLSDYEHDLDDEDFLLERLEEEDAYNCELCSKTFNQASKLKMHMRCHKNCHVCKAVFRSSEALSYHQAHVCFKLVIANQPNIRLTRCDDSAEMQVIKSNMPTIQFGFEETQDGVMLISDDEEHDAVGELQPPEVGYIRGLFDKYKSMRTSGSKLPRNQADKHIGTDSLSDASIKVNKSQIIVEGMYGSLQFLRVPIKLRVQPELTALLELRQQEKGVTISETWSTKPKQLAKKPVVLNGLNRPLPTIVAKNYNCQIHNQQMFITLNGPNQPAQLQSAVHNLPQMVHQTPMQFVSNQAFFQQVQYVAQPPEQVIPQTIAAPQPQSVDRIVHIAQKPDSSQQQASNPFLRVKSPWELNKL